MKKIILILLLIATNTLSSYAQHHFEKVDEWLSANVEKMGGRVILVVYKDGKVIYTGSKDDMTMKQKFVTKMIARKMGKAPNTDAFTPTSKIPVASCSKWFSAALVMTFVDEGKLKLDDTVGKYLPVLTKSGKGGITISQCLSHLTGVRAPDLKESLQEMRQMNSMDEAIQNIADMPMEGKPGTVFRYSNTGLQIAGAIIEKISGKSFETLFAERIAQPLNMINSDFGKGAVALPAGGAYSTPNDYLNFLAMILNKGMFNGKRILSEKSIIDMQINRITANIKVAYSPAEASNAGYGFGEWVLKVPGTHKSSFISSPGLFGSFPWVNNDKHYAAFMMTFYINSEGRNKRYYELNELVNEAL
ncbi:serine hydrolase domain-containing protein [Mucilaginibacter dorajii]|uniref:Beta-lactamase-related domain-containing protein n=1 Tax=Mucilaginibacter dorajii TaxID=692994 RepID=A0ABP7P3I5_9SPHI|nr:serine hydrolase domain-containing protein [Mucilaginibacter dorajii]MCS3734348.1 CubicO group peptidase (beta-lactamase class C family) [Mucilaginibacter dorajii]